MGCLYKLTSPSGKSYIGISSKTAAERWHKHVEHALGKRENGALYNALRKYGPDAFTLETLVIANFPYLRELEKRAIRALGTLYPRGYNIALGGEGWMGPRNDEFRINASIAQKKRYTDPEQLKLLRSYGDKARIARAEKCASRRIDGKAPWVIKQEKKRDLERQWSMPKKGQHLSIEARKVISAATKQAMLRPEVREKIIAYARARAADPEWRKKISASKKGHKPPPYTGASHQARSEGAKRMWIRRKAKNVAQS